MASRVVGAVLTQLCSVGPDALTIEAVADRAHVSVGSIYKDYGSLDALVESSLGAELAGVCEAIPDLDPLPPRLLNPQGADRLVLEAILATRRFPSTTPLVQARIAKTLQRVGPLRLAVVLGCQGVALAGAVPSPVDREALTALEHRIRGGDLHDRPMTPLAIELDEPGVPHPAPERNDPTTVRLREATSELLTDTAGRASLREIADRAGVTTGAVYRRYQSKDDLIGDTVQARITAERTQWAEQFFRAIADPTAGDPAMILATVLAQASAPDEANTRESIELVVAARTGPAARAALSERFLGAVRTRKEQFALLARLDLLHHADSVDALAWAFQMTPTGARIAGLVVGMPDAEGWRPSMAALLKAL